VVWRSAEFLPKELVFNINYLGADQASFTLNFSKGASQVIGQYYQLIRLGKHGYRAIMSNLTRTADYLSDSLEALGFVIMSKKSGQGLPLVAFHLPEDKNEERTYDEFALAHQLRVRGWVVPAYTMAPHTNGLKMLRVVVREDFSRNRCDALLNDIKLSQQVLQEMDKGSIKTQQEFINKHHTSSGKATHNHPKFRVRSCTTFDYDLDFVLKRLRTNDADRFNLSDYRRRNTRSKARRARPTPSAEQSVSGDQSPSRPKRDEVKGDRKSVPMRPSNAHIENNTTRPLSPVAEVVQPVPVPVPLVQQHKLSPRSLSLSAVATSSTRALVQSPTSTSFSALHSTSKFSSPQEGACLSFELPGGQKLLNVRIVGCAS